MVRGAAAVEKRVSELSVVRLPGGQAEPDREALRADDDVYLGREPLARGPRQLSAPLVCRRGLLVGASGAVDYLDSAVVGRGNGIYQLIPHTRLSPQHEAVVASGGRAIALGQIAPRRSRQTERRRRRSTGAGGGCGPQCNRCEPINHIEHP